MCFSWQTVYADYVCIPFFVLTSAVKTIYLAAAFWAHPPDPGPCSGRCTGCPRRRSPLPSPQHPTAPLAPPTTAGREEGAGAKPSSQCSSCPLPWRQAQRERGLVKTRIYRAVYRYNIWGLTPTSQRVFAHFYSLNEQSLLLYYS